MIGFRDFQLAGALPLRSRSFALHPLLEIEMTHDIIKQITDGRTDLVLDIVRTGLPATTADEAGTPLIKWCAYYGDVSAIRFLLENGESLQSLGDNLDIHGAAFHGHWRLCQFLIAQGADVNKPLAETGESPLHAALCTTERLAHDLVLRVLLASGANPNCLTKPGVETGSFMRDCRTKGEAPLHRAAAFGSAETIQMLLDAKANIREKDMNGDSALSWASWHLRPDAILRMLCYDDVFIRPERRTIAAYLLGAPHA